MNYLLSRVNINDVWELESALETNMFEIEMPDKTLVHIETVGGEKKFLLSQKLCICFCDREIKPPGAMTDNTHCKLCCV